MKGDIRVSISDARGYPCPKDGTILTLLPGGAWCSECHTVWREKGEIPLSVAMYEIPSQERIAALEELEDAAEWMRDHLGSLGEHYAVAKVLSYLASSLATRPGDPPGRDREDTT
jgi:hypothetical protein